MARSAAGSTSGRKAPKRKRALVAFSEEEDDIFSSTSSDADDSVRTKANTGTKTQGKKVVAKTKALGKGKQVAKAKAWKLGDPGGLDRLEELVEAEYARGMADKATLKSLGIRDEVTEVREMEPDTVLDEIELAVAQVIKTVMAGRGFEYRIPTRTRTNQRYIPELDRIVLKSENKMVRSFVNANTVKKAAITTRAMDLIHQVLRKKIHITKRDLFYTDVKLFVDQSHSDAVLDDLACMLGCTRTSLHVVASEKGIVVGKLTFRDDGDLIDCRYIQNDTLFGKLRRTYLLESSQYTQLVSRRSCVVYLITSQFQNNSHELCKMKPPH
jgi:hypothetical protein